MCYNLELSFNVYKHLNITFFENKVIDMVIEHGGTFDIHYESNENKWKLHTCIISVQFEKTTEGIQNCTRFIKKVKETPQLHIETIYEENSNKIDMLYATNYYLQQLDEYSAKNFKENKKKRSYSEDQTKIMNALQNVVKKKKENTENKEKENKEKENKETENKEKENKEKENKEKEKDKTDISYEEYLKML